MSPVRRDLLVVLAFAMAAGLATAGPFAWQHTLYHDTLHAYSYFADNLDSLHRFGEPAWWSPNITAGVPGYFYGMLGQPSLARPAFAAIGAVVWAMGRAGLPLSGVHPLYVFYFGFLLPTLFLLGVWAVARRLYRTRTAVFYVLAVAAFSPGILVNLSDPGILESTAYALLWTAAYLSWVGTPGRRSFAVLSAATLLLALGASQMVLATAGPLLAAVVAGSLACTRSARRAVQTLRPTWLATTLVLLAVVALPSAIVYRQQSGEVVHADIGRGLDYDYGELKSGNPVQFLIGSLPGVAFDWDVYKQPKAGPPAEYGLHTLAWGDDVGNNYLGLLALPLAAIGFVAGRRKVRAPLFVATVIVGACFLMYGASPAFAPLLVALAPLRSLNHFGDMLYGGGGFLLVLFAAGLGLETIERRRDLLRRMAIGFPIWSVAALLLYRATLDPPDGLFGFAALLSAAFSVLFAWGARSPRRTRARTLAVGVVALTLLDVSTVAFWYLRGVVPGGERVDESHFGHAIGDENDATTRLARVFLMREVKALAEAGIAVESLPLYAAFCAAAPEDGPITAAQIAAGFAGPPAERRVVLHRDAASDRALAAFAAAPDRCEVEIGRGRGTYNTVAIPLRAAQPALLFLRDAWAPEWRATLNETPVPIHRAFGAFKAIELPAGKSVLRLVYRPPLLGVALLAAYATVLVAGVVALRMRD